MTDNLAVFKLKTTAQVLEQELVEIKKSVKRIQSTLSLLNDVVVSIEDSEKNERRETNTDAG